MAARKQLDRAFELAMAELRRLGGDISALSAPLQTVVIVQTAQGIIDNGGFRYLFEGDFPRNPPYSLFVEAYRRIGADECADVFAKAVELFPFEDPHLNARKRNELLDRWEDDPADPFERLSDRVCGNRAVWELLERYVQQNALEFKGLDQ